MSIPFKRVMFGAVMLLVALGVSRAAIYRFRQQEDAFRKACREQLQKLGLTPAAAKAQYPTPEIKMVSAACVLPGATGEVVVKGKFAPQTKFFFENDNIEVVKENLTAGEYRAPVKAMAGIGPQAASLMAITPVSGASAQHPNAVAVGGSYEWTMETANGWNVVARSRGNQPCGDPSAQGAYEVAFYRKGESAPFERRLAALYFTLWEKSNYRFSISRTDSQVQAEQEDMTALSRKLSDPKLTPAQRQEIIKKVQQAADKMRANMGRMGDPAKQQQFGCERVELEYPGGGSFTGQMSCSEKVGRRIALTGKVALK